MRVKDEQAWWEQLVEFDADDHSRNFRDFLLAWVDAADVRIAGGRNSDPRSALVAAFEDVELERGFLSVEWLAQMLLVIVQHWFSGDELWASLTVWERRLVEQTAAMKLAELQAVAAAEAAPADSSQIDA